MKRPWLVWLIFGAFLAVVLSAMGWISHEALRFEEAETAAIARADHEEDVRWALWRMQNSLNALLAPEVARPYLDFSTPDPASPQFREALLTAPGRHVRLHYELDAEGAITSPLVFKDPKLAQRLAGRLKATHLTPATFERAKQDLVSLRAFVSQPAVAERMPKDLEGTSQSLLVARDQVGNSLGQAPNQQGPNQFVGQLDYGNANSDDNELRGRSRRGEGQQSQINNSAYLARQGSTQTFADNNGKTANFAVVGDVRVGAMRPLWLGEELLLARWVRRKECDVVQGAWLDWPSLRDELLVTVRDRFPQSSLHAVDSAAADDELTRARLLAYVPLRFDPGPFALASLDAWTPLRVSLAVAWGCVLLAALAVAALLLGVLRLSERRAAFVSAVTHELRTPLTTFRMYADMLARGMVPQPERQRQYLNTLRVESDRLSHLVANVLSYARLERGRPLRQLQSIPLAELISQPQARLRDRAAQDGLELRIAIDPTLVQATARCEPSVVEQILFNLVDNACKYAAHGLPSLIEISAGASPRGVFMQVRDHGPGIAPGDRRRIFRTFGKSAHQAAASAPGVGLGLGLSRRLARAMGGDLRLQPTQGPGATFVLMLRT